VRLGLFALLVVAAVNVLAEAGVLLFVGRLPSSCQRNLSKVVSVLN
jgi:hypothetical protein